MKLILLTLISSCFISCSTSPSKVSSDGSYALIRVSKVKIEDVEDHKDYPTIHKIDGKTLLMTGMTYEKRLQPGNHSVVFIASLQSNLLMAITDPFGKPTFSRFEFSHHFKSGRTYEVSSFRLKNNFLWKVDDITTGQPKTILEKKLPKRPESEWYDALKE